MLKNKFHVVLFAGAPSSDVSFLQQWFAGNPSLQLSTYIQKQGAVYYDGEPTREKLGAVDLVILAGWPIASTSDASISLVSQLLSQEKTAPSHRIAHARCDEARDARRCDPIHDERALGIASGDEGRDVAFIGRNR